MMLKIIVLVPMITQPTRASESLATLIEEIIMLIPEKKTFLGIIAYDISDFLAEFVIRKKRIHSTNLKYSSIFESYRNTYTANLNKLNEVLSYHLSRFSFTAQSLEPEA